MHTNVPINLVIAVLSGTLLLTACDEKSSSSGAPLQPIATLPTEFVDNLGAEWICAANDLSDEVTGRVTLEEPPTLMNTDILHVMLLDEQFNSINSYCINNIAKTPISFALTYDSSTLNNDTRYFISATYFQYIDGNMYEAVRKPDGRIEVISNGIVEQVDIRLKPR